MSKKVLLIIFFVALLIVAGYLLWHNSQETTPVVGGQCTYQTVPGKCTVTAINSNESFRFSFAPSDPSITLSAEWVTMENITSKEYIELFSLFNQACSDKCSANEGDVLDCKLNVITSGTCTPILFDFE